MWKTLSSDHFYFDATIQDSPSRLKGSGYGTMLSQSLSTARCLATSPC